MAEGVWVKLPTFTMKSDSIDWQILLTYPVLIIECRFL